MNKLSNILLAKNKNISSKTEVVNRNNFTEKGFDKQTLTATVIGGAKRTIKRKPKFLYVSLAMMASKGVNTEDRLIFRSTRLGGKGGVDDLAQEKLSKKTKFKIKKAKATGRGYNLINPKYREKASKIVQGWWRERKEKYKKIFYQIIKK